MKVVPFPTLSHWLLLSGAPIHRLAGLVIIVALGPIHRLAGWCLWVPIEGLLSLWVDVDDSEGIVTPGSPCGGHCLMKACPIWQRGDHGQLDVPAAVPHKRKWGCRGLIKCNLFPFGLKEVAVCAERVLQCPASIYILKGYSKRMFQLCHSKNSEIHKLLVEQILFLYFCLSG